MKRNLNELSKHEYDVVIIGAGIYGVNAAWDATLRGLKVALIDKCGETEFRMVEGSDEFIQLEALLSQVTLAGIISK